MRSLAKASTPAEPLRDLVKRWADMILADQDGRVRGRHAGVARRPEFCPLEDVLGVGSFGGLSTILVPGAGTANFDRFHYRPTTLPPAIASPAPAPSLIPRLLPHSQLQRVRPAVRTGCLRVCLCACLCVHLCASFEANPFRTKKQRREKEVVSLLDKVRASRLSCGVRW